MGLGPSRIIDHSDALERLGTDAAAYEAAFSRVVGSRKRMSFQNFHSLFLSPILPGVPIVLSKKIFAAFIAGGNSAAVELEDFVCSLAILARGTAEERTRFLFDAYRRSDVDFVSAEELEALVQRLDAGLVRSLHDGAGTLASETPHVGTQYPRPAFDDIRQYAVPNDGSYGNGELARRRARKDFCDSSHLTPLVPIIPHVFFFVLLPSKS